MEEGGGGGGWWVVSGSGKGVQNLMGLRKSHNGTITALMTCNIEKSKSNAFINMNISSSLYQCYNCLSSY